MFSAAYVGLFVAAFGAATLLPLQSEVMLVGLLTLGEAMDGNPAIRTRSSRWCTTWWADE